MNAGPGSDRLTRKATGDWPLASATSLRIVTLTSSLTESQLEEVWEPLLAVAEAADRMMNEPYQASIDNAAVGLRQRLAELRRAVEAAGK